MRKNPHVRIRGGLGSVTALVYPTVGVCRRMMPKPSPGTAWRPRRATPGRWLPSGASYDTGRGVPQDNVEAHTWLNLAASRLTGEQREEVVTARDRVTERMTPADLSEAQRRAREWNAAHR